VVARGRRELGYRPNQWGSAGSELRVPGAEQETDPAGPLVKIHGQYTFSGLGLHAVALHSRSHAE
jgi:hypothetical protein